MKIALKLLVPFDYLRIAHPEKRKLDIYIPLILSILAVIFGYWIVPDIKMTGADGVYDRFLTFAPTLIGFYVAALAAVATFNKPDMDETMPGDPVLLNPIDSAPTEPAEHLTRRRLLCLQFGYLCALSIVIVILSFMGMFVGDRLVSGGSSITAYSIIFNLVFFFCVFNLITTTLFSIYYLVDRIHKPTFEIKGLYRKTDISE